MVVNNSKYKPTINFIVIIIYMLYGSFRKLHGIHTPPIWCIHNTFRFAFMA